ncbi:MAG TPA: MltA domain-containing protein [Abditibacteriaceae bacterium]
MGQFIKRLAVSFEPLALLLLRYTEGAMILRILLIISFYFVSSAVAANEFDVALQTAYRERVVMRRAISANLRWLQSPRGRALYMKFHKTQRGGPSREMILRSLQRLQAVTASRSQKEFMAAMRRDFLLWQPSVQAAHFTGYFEPVYEARRQPDARFRWPLYGLPNLAQWPRPHPTRLQLEGGDGKKQSPLLRGHALAYLPSRFQAYLVQVQGSARLRFPDKVVAVGYAGRTQWNYTGIGRELINDGKIPFEQLTQQSLLAYFRAHPHELNNYLPRNKRFVFLRPTKGRPATGALGIPLVAGRSMATDKTSLPPGAVALASVPLRNPLTARVFGNGHLSRLLFDHDTGGAIKGPARVDIFMGSGTQAGERAGALNAVGMLNYLLLKSDAVRLKSGRTLPLN